MGRRGTQALQNLTPAVEARDRLLLHGKAEQQKVQQAMAPQREVAMAGLFPPISGTTYL